jgi:FdrA protein
MTAVVVKRGRWVDSAKMMAAARAAEGIDGVERALCFMATPANREEAASFGVHDPAIDDAGPDDLVIAVQGAAADEGLAAAEDLLDRRPAPAAGGQGAGPRPPRSLRRAEADLAVVSVPGEYAALEAHKALGAGMDVLLFSDGVSLEDEVVLKRRAHSLGRLVMGPGAGTAILDGLALGFANVVARGSVGVVAAAGTGAQEVTVLVDRAGAGVSACYGTGGRDLKDEVGAITALDALDRLAADGDTAVILCVSKPPSRDVAERVLRALAASGKPAAACMVGGGVDPVDGVTLAATLEEAALAAAGLAGHPVARPRDPTVEWVSGGAVRGLFSGGTLCSEAAAILAERLGAVHSNAPAGRALPLEGRPRGHAVLDLGEEEFTRGRPHPMIDPAARAERLVEEAADPEVGVLLLDVVLGYASHPDPASVLVPAIREATARRPQLAVVAYVLGTERDPQVRSRQEAALEEAGVRLAPTSAGAARLAAAIAGS